MMRSGVEAAYPVRTVTEGSATPRVVYDGLVLYPVIRPRRGRDSRKAPPAAVPGSDAAAAARERSRE
jgi:hypothetical protein